MSEPTTEPALKPLSRVESLFQVLKLAGIPARLEALTEKGSQQGLVVGPRPWRLDAAGYTLEIFYLNDLLAATRQPGLPQSDSLQFTSSFACEIQTEALPELALLFSSLNLLLPYGHFALSASRQASLQYALKVPPGYLPGLVLIEVLDALCYYLEQTSGPIRSVASGQLTAADAIVEVERLLGTVDPKLDQNQAES